MEVSYLVAWRKVRHLVQNCGREEENTTYIPCHVLSTSHTLSPLIFINYKVKALFYSHWVLVMERHNKLPPQKWKAEFFITYSSVSSKKAAVQVHTRVALGERVIASWNYRRQLWMASQIKLGRFTQVSCSFSILNNSADLRKKRPSKVFGIWGFL